MTSNNELTTELNGKKYIVSKLKSSLDTHDETIDSDLLIPNSSPIEHDTIVGVHYGGKFQVILGIIPNDIQGKVKVKVVSKFSLKRAEDIPFVENVQESDFANHPRINTKRFDRKDKFEKSFSRNKNY